MLKPSFMLVAAVSITACGEDPRINGPYIERVAPDTVVVSWETSTPQETELEWGPTAAYGYRTSVPGASSLHRVELTELSPDTVHHYRVVASEGDVDDHTFKTASHDSTSLRFAVYGDSQSNSFTHSEIARSIAIAEPAFVLHVGDSVQEGLEQELWHEQFFAPAKTLLANVPVYATMGNHEQNSEWFYYYHSYEGSKSYYSFAHGPAFVVTLDTNQSFDRDSEQYAWLLKTLSSRAAQDATWLFVTYHHPGFTNGWQDCTFDGEPAVRDVLMPLMAKYQVDVVFNGHMHGYERGAQDGVQYVVSGGGGGALDQRCRQWPNIFVSEYRHHYVTVDLDGGSLKLQAHDTAGRIFDELAIRK